MPTPSQPPTVAFLAWTPISGRAVDIASSLGGVAWVDYDERWRGWRTPFRYVRSAFRQSRHLRRTRPESIIATNPPVFCGLVAYAHARRTGRPFVLDSHPTGFGFKENRLSQLLQPVHRALARRAAAVLVTVEDTAAIVEGWGGRAILVHEPPAGLDIDERPPRERPLIAYIGTFASDEPVDEVIEAARAVPEVDVAVTGRPSRAPEGMVADAPDNVDFVGWLGPDEYRDLLRDATAVVSLTTEPTSVMRSAYEAVYAGRPIVLSDTPVLRPLFPDAVFTANEAASMADAFRTVVSDLEALDARAAAARRAQLARWDDQRDELLGALGQRP